MSLFKTPLESQDSSLATVSLHALSAGHFSLPEEQFVRPASPGARKTVPSLCFLLQHTCASSGNTTRIVFDLGLRRDVKRYSEPIQRHVSTRQPMSTDPDVVKSLRAGGLTPNDIDVVIYSHVHWDHVGEPRDFLRSTFVVGHGSVDVLAGKSSTLRGGHSFFEADLLDLSRTIELLDPICNQDEIEDGKIASSLSSTSANFSRPWQALDIFPSALDIFNDGSLYIVDAPGHLTGHVNLLALIKDGGGVIRWVYLAGDACHDRRIMRHEREISEWHDASGHLCCIHADRPKAEATIERIRALETNGVEVIFAHDVEWEKQTGNQKRFFGSAQ
ncbi:beta-lactamase-like protein [Lasiosphaeria hispida]|uniref:Beta-lactamase-like protein n=1 Tax=Lasiosphaeria hispida TaxID=260671 RepID=A0AAJ0HKF8_9PEZI|nr:beta-lactamase-like protein [Lasiosphaeria hispida]